MNRIKQSLLIICLTLCSTLALGAGAQINYDFCSLSPGVARESDPRQLPIWNADTVQVETAKLATSDKIQGTPLAAYPTSYVAMTKIRDRERCRGDLAITDRRSRLIGDHLADLMSRWLVLSIEECQGISVDAIGICGSASRTISNGFGTLESALDMTAVYLSAHMGAALLAVVFDDQFWAQEFPPATHCTTHPCPSGVMKSRVDFLKRYKPYYDLNNKFLATNISTVAQSLQQACLIKGPAIAIGARVAERLPLEPLFKTVRDETFAAVLASISAVNLDLHPMLQKNGDTYSTQFASFKLWQEPPQAIVFAERKARSLLSNALVTGGLGLLGSRTPEDLATTPLCQ